MGNALHLDGTGWADGSDAGIPSGPAAKSISLWFRTTAGGALFSLGDDTSNGRLLDVSIGAGVLTAQVWGQSVVAGSGLDDGQWHCLIVEFTGSNFIGVFLDDPAALAGGLATGLDTTATGTFTVGRSPLAIAPDFVGDLDDICVHDVALDGAGRDAYWNAGAGTDTPPTTGLVQRWKLNEASGTTAAESIAGTNPLALHGGATFAAGLVPGGAPAAGLGPFSGPTSSPLVSSRLIR